MKRLLAAAVLGLALAVLPAGAAGAHPLGNFTVNTAIGLRVGTDVIGVDLVVDMAEIPTVQARRGIDTDGDGSIGEREAGEYASQGVRRCSAADHGHRRRPARAARRQVRRRDLPGRERRPGHACA